MARLRGALRRLSLDPLDALRRPTFLVPEGVFSAANLEREPRRVASLSDYVGELAGPPHLASALLRGVLGEARSSASQLSELRFALTELLPLLRSFDRPARRRGAGLPRIPVSAFHALEAPAAELLERLGARFPAAELPPDVLAEWVRAPCAIAGSAVVPLERVGRTPAPGRPTRVGGELYRLRPDEAWPFAALVRRVQLKAKRNAERLLARDTALTSLAEDFVAEVRSIVERFRPQARGGFDLLHRDRDHQLLHRGGHWLLVRGPLARSRSRGGAFVGLHLRGRTRAERLAVVPRLCACEEGLWTPDGVPSHGGLCMGGGGQYRRLLTRRFTDAEAVVHWLDAGVIVATGRSDFHRSWRAHSKPRVGRLVYHHL
jgi:hypothetical protein